MANLNSKDEVDKNRLMASVLNKKAVMCFLIITDKTPQCEKDRNINQALDLLREARRFDKDNATVNLNSYLLRWQIGKIRDDQFLSFLQEKLVKQDMVLSSLIFLLFKKNILGFLPDNNEYYQV